MHSQTLLPAILTALSYFSASVRAHSPRHHKADPHTRNLNTITSIYNLTIYPNNVPIITRGGSAVPAGLFGANATGRVSPLGNFTSFEDSIEYFFALALVPVAPAYSVFTSAKVVEFSSGCPEVAASVAYLETRTYNSNSTELGPYVSTLKQVAFWRFDDEGAVLKYDAWIPNLRKWIYLAQGQEDFTNPLVQAGTIQKLCPAVQERCIGTNVQYNSTEQCEEILGKKTFGDYDEVWGDNVVCRAVHLILAGANPDTHCPHVGPTGAMKCVDDSYNDGYFDDEDLYGTAEGKTFVCPQKGE